MVGSRMASKLAAGAAQSGGAGRYCRSGRAQSHGQFASFDIWGDNAMRLHLDLSSCRCSLTVISGIALSNPDNPCYGENQQHGTWEDEHGSMEGQKWQHWRANVLTNSVSSPPPCTASDKAILGKQSCETQAGTIRGKRSKGPINCPLQTPRSQSLSQR